MLTRRLPALEEALTHGARVPRPLISGIDSRWGANSAHSRERASTAKPNGEGDLDSSDPLQSLVFSMRLRRRLPGPGYSAPSGALGAILQPACVVRERNH